MYDRDVIYITPLVIRSLLSQDPLHWQIHIYTSTLVSESQYLTKHPCLTASETRVLYHRS